jgi:hypothetical protein
MTRVDALKKCLHVQIRRRLAIVLLAALQRPDEADIQHSSPEKVFCRGEWTNHQPGQEAETTAGPNAAVCPDRGEPPVEFAPCRDGAMAPASMIKESLC